MKIVIAYDGSEDARNAIADLAAAGLPADTTAVVMSASDVLPGLLEGKATPGESRALTSAREKARHAHENAQKLAGEGAKLVSSQFPGWKVSAEAVDDSPYWAFVNRATGTDLIVLGTRGRSAIESALLGSVSQNVLSYAGCSVRIGRGTGKRGGPVKLVVAFDGSPTAEAAVAAVAARQWPKGSSAHVVTAAEGLTLSKLIDEGATDGRVPAMVENVAAKLRAAGLEVTTVISEDDAKDAILDAAKKTGAGCIFLGARGLTRMERMLLGSVAGAVASRAACSVEVVRG